MRVINKVGFFGALFLFSSSLLAASSTPQPPLPGPIALGQQPASPYPGFNISYNFPVLPNIYPTIDQPSYNYLPYLPWIGQNVFLLTGYLNLFYQEEYNAIQAAPYNAAQTVLVNGTFISSDKQTLENAVNATTLNVRNMLAPNIFGGLSPLSLSSIPGSDTALPNTTPAPTNFAFNADNLMGTLGFNSDQKPNMNNLIVFLAGLSQPVPSLTLSTDSKIRSQQLQNALVQNYILTERALTASQSVAASNFNYLANEREVVSGLGSKAGMTTLPSDGTEKPVNDVSQLQLENFLVDRRVGNSAWYTTMSTAPAIVVQRETLFVLAELQKQILQLQMVNERMLATMSVMQTQMTQFGKTTVLANQQEAQTAAQQVASSGNG